MPSKIVLSLAVVLTAAAEPAGQLWNPPGDLSKRNLLYGPGGREHEPRGSFRFIEEEMDGTNPKIVVEDERGARWKVKLGAEAQPETAASRLIWAIGYFADEDYVVPNARIENLPVKLRRGQRFVEAGGSIRKARFERMPEGRKKSGHWRWQQNPFTGTRELNGLRVMMSLLNNWDTIDGNTAIYETPRGRIYVVSDLGAAFGPGRETWPLRHAQGNLEAYRKSKFVKKVTADYVDFHAPHRPELWYLFLPREYFGKSRLRWIGRGIPRGDARWLGELLGRLSPEQIRDAFRASAYSPEETEGFAKAVEERIAKLREL
jgi:hypothetical protein